MNIDFAGHFGFSAYVLLLMFSGLVMVFLGSPVVRSSKTWIRVFNVVLGLAYFGYGFYLAFLWQGGTYLIFFKAFIVPIVMLIRTAQAARLRRAQTVVPGAPQWNEAGYPVQQPYQPQQQWPAQQHYADQQQWPAQQEWPAQQQWPAQQEWPAQQQNPDQQWPTQEFPAQQQWPAQPPAQRWPGQPPVPPAPYGQQRPRG
jgi:hypothetical protein